MYVVYYVYIGEGRLKKCTWHLEQKVLRFVIGHSLGSAPKKAVFPEQMSFRLMF